jgi:hypothetical protein
MLILGALFSRLAHLILSPSCEERNEERNAPEFARFWQTVIARLRPVAHLHLQHLRYGRRFCASQQVRMWGAVKILKTRRDPSGVAQSLATVRSSPEASNRHERP